MQWRNPTRNAFGTIDVEINHPIYGWIPFTADADDAGAGFDVAALVAEIEAGAVPDAPAPDAEAQLAAWRAQAKVSRFQAYAALDAAGLLDEATAAVTAAGGIALLAWNNAIEFRRNSPNINALAGELNLTPEQLDALFVAAAGIEA